MPIQTRTIPPTVAFPVTYEGELMAIYHCYEDDDFDKDCEFIYTADIKEGIREGSTDISERNEFFFNILDLSDGLESLGVKASGFRGRFAHEMILDLAIKHGLISFDVEGRVTIHEIKEVSNG
jgi:hypothetical protein